ncbi:hypothetical protein FQZ97_402040 [compost metagenome]
MLRSLDYPAWLPHDTGAHDTRIIRLLLLRWSSNRLESFVHTLQNLPSAKGKDDPLHRCETSRHSFAGRLKLSSQALTDARRGVRATHSQ